MSVKAILQEALKGVVPPSNIEEVPSTSMSEHPGFVDVIVPTDKLEEAQNHMKAKGIICSQVEKGRESSTFHYLNEEIHLR